MEALKAANMKTMLDKKPEEDVIRLAVRGIFALEYLEGKLLKKPRYTRGGEHPRKKHRCQKNFLYKEVRSA